MVIFAWNYALKKKNDFSFNDNETIDVWSSAKFKPDFWRFNNGTYVSSPRSASNVQYTPHNVVLQEYLRWLKMKVVDIVTDAYTS